MIDPILQALIQDVVDSANDNCFEDFTVVSKSAIAALAEYARQCNWLRDDG